MLVKETEIEIVVNTTFYDNQNQYTTQLAHYAAERYELTYCLKKSKEASRQIKILNTVPLNLAILKIPLRKI